MAKHGQYLKSDNANLALLCIILIECNHVRNRKLRQYSPFCCINSSVNATILSSL